MAGPIASNGKPLRYVVFLQENKTTDFYFAKLAAWGAHVANNGNLLTAPPDHDQPHDRNAWVHYRMGDYPAYPVQVDTDAVIPFYSYLAKTGTFLDNHFGVGSNSTSGHLVAMTGQTPTMRNPSFTGPHPTWDLPTVFQLAEKAGITWGIFPDQDGYPTKFIKELSDPAMKGHVHTQAEFETMAANGTLPQLCYVWSRGGLDEHPPFRTSDPQYITNGMNHKWQQVSAVINAGEWVNTIFDLNWDDWGGYADSVPTPNIATLPDALHPNGFQAIGGSRIPRIIFGGPVKQGVDSRASYQGGIGRSAADVLGLGQLGVPIFDKAPSLADRIDLKLSTQPPPVFGQPLVQPTPPSPPIPPQPLGAWPGPLDQPMAPIILNGGVTQPPPTDGIVRPNPPKPPAVAAAPMVISRLPAAATQSATLHLRDGSHALFAADVVAVARGLAGRSLTWQADPAGRRVHVSGTAQEMGRLLGSPLMNVSGSDGAKSVETQRPMQLPKSLAGWVTGVSGLSASHRSLACLDPSGQQQVPGGVVIS